jgi:hypothetical protein
MNVGSFSRPSFLLYGFGGSRHSEAMVVSDFIVQYIMAPEKVLMVAVGRYKSN